MMTTAEVAEYLRTTVPRVYGLVERGTIPYKKPGRHRRSGLRFSKADIDEWMSAVSVADALNPPAWH